ncbi:hypothetical protein [Saccharibacillus alkalitolerans]|uniref:Uncharacterized protein n=1 Tax=Saccharibacillus alkalitolerans TaxID=2705290 RepID=A0ABX0FAG1_9BACL|nr:hypothetical protein [Saccharibacillus alkalitolerans]NGZ77933.1 hypothetical protein [Saccharibacillus alkalitolerans]
MSGTRRSRKKIPALAAMALMTALTGSVLPAERASAAPSGSETPKSGREAKASPNGSKQRRSAERFAADGSADPAAPIPASAAYGEPPSLPTASAASSDFAKLTAKGNVQGMWRYIDAHAASASPASVTVWLHRLEAVQFKRLAPLEESLSGSEVQAALMNADLFAEDGSWKRGVRTGLPQADALLRELETDGYVLDTTEGYYFPKIDYERYLKYADDVGRRYADYLTIRADETRSELTKDAGLIVSWEELLDRAERQRLYLERYPSSPESDTVGQMYAQSLYIVLYGTDNVPLFDFRTGEIDPDARAAYKRKAAEGGPSSFAKMLRGYVRLLEQGGGKLTRQAEAFREARNPWKE